MVISLIIIGLLVIVNGICLYVIRNLLKKVETYEDFIQELRQNALNILSQIKSIDIRGSFEADDEVGVVYSGIRTMVLRLSQFLE